MDWMQILTDFVVLTIALFVAGLLVSWIHRRQEHRHAAKEEQKAKQEQYGSSSKAPGPKQGQK